MKEKNVRPRTDSWPRHLMGVGTGTVPRSQHAARRQQQRATGHAAVDATLLWGRLIRQTHQRMAYFLDVRSVRTAAHFGEDITAFVGTAVVQAADGGIVTVIRCPSPRRLKWRSK